MTLSAADFSAPAPIRIREFRSDDIPAIREMAARIWRAHYVPAIVTAEQIEYMLLKLYSDAALKRNVEEKQQRIWLAEVSGSIAGYIAAEPRQHGQWFIDKLYIDLSGQRKGLGSALLSHAIRELAPRELMLRVNRKNIPAINFYFKQGFYITGLDVLDIGQGFVMDDFLMRRFA